MHLNTNEIQQIIEIVEPWKEINFDILYAAGPNTCTWNELDTTSIMIFVIDTINTIRSSIQRDLFATLGYGTITSFYLQITNFDAQIRTLSGIKSADLVDQHFAALDALLCLRTLLTNSGLYTLAKLRPQHSEPGGSVDTLHGNSEQENEIFA